MFVNLPYYYYYYFGSLFSTVYFVGFWTWKSCTLGNMALGVRIVTEDGEPISFGRALVRYFGYIVCWIAPFGFGALVFLNFLSLGFWWIGWDKRKQGWHDKLANTFVVKN